MAVISRSVTVGTSAVEIAGPSIRAKLVYVQNGDYDGTAEVYVGGSDVTVNNGVRSWRDSTAVFELNSDDALFAISDTANTSVRVVEVTNL